MLVQLFSRSCLSAVHVGPVLCDAELSKFVVDLDAVESFLVMLRIVHPDTKGGLRAERQIQPEKLLRETRRKNKADSEK